MCARARSSMRNCWRIASYSRCMHVLCGTWVGGCMCASCVSGWMHVCTRQVVDAELLADRIVQPLHACVVRHMGGWMHVCKLREWVDACVHAPGRRCGSAGEWHRTAAACMCCAAHGWVDACVQVA